MSPAARAGGAHPARAQYVVWCAAGPLPVAATLCAYLWGQVAPAGWEIDSGDDPPWSPSWSRLTIRQHRYGTTLALHVALVRPDGIISAFSPWERAAGGRGREGRVAGRLRDLAAAHRVRFRRVLGSRYDTLILVEGSHSPPPAAEGAPPDQAATLALAAACEIGRLMGGVVVDGARNIGTPREMAARHRLTETAVTWLHAVGEHPAAIDAQGVLTVRCHLARARFDAAQGGVDGQPLAGLTPRWELWPAPPLEAEPTADDSGAVSAAPSGDEPAAPVAHGRLAPLSAPAGAYQASVAPRRGHAGGRYVLYVDPDDGTVGVRNGALPFRLPADAHPY